MSDTAYILTNPGEPLQRVERARASPARRQALVRNRATTVNFHDILNIAGVLPNLANPRVPFSDNCGEIVALGEDCNGWSVGDRVVANFFPNWIDGPPRPHYCANLYGDQIDGFLAQYTLVETRSLIRPPAHLSDAEAASLCCAGLTAWRSVAVEARIQPGQTVVIQGTGGVSLFALQFAKLFGAQVILTSSSDEKLALGKSLGADHTHNYKRDPDWDAAVTAITNGNGAELIVEIGGADTMARSINAAALDGHVSVIGVRSGFGQATTISPELILMKNLTVRGITVGSVRQLGDMCQAVAQHRIKPVIDRHFEFADVEAAIALMQSQNHAGKIAIDIAV
jgi:NADPH:quinone reductase-like Zn-dependent oxidoreductase